MNTHSDDATTESESYRPDHLLQFGACLVIAAVISTLVVAVSRHGYEAPVGVKMMFFLAFLAEDNGLENATAFLVLRFASVALWILVPSFLFLAIATGRQVLRFSLVMFCGLVTAAFVGGWSAFDPSDEAFFRRSVRRHVGQVFDRAEGQFAHIVVGQPSDPTMQNSLVEVSLLKEDGARFHVRRMRDPATGRLIGPNGGFFLLPSRMMRRGRVEICWYDRTPAMQNREVLLEVKAGARLETEIVECRFGQTVAAVAE